MADFSLNNEVDDSEAGSPQQLRLPEVTADGHVSLGGGEERLEASLEGEKREVETVSRMESTDWSQDMEKMKIGEGARVSWPESDQIFPTFWEEGTVWVLEGGQIEIRSKIDKCLLWKKEILADEEYWKESGKQEDKCVCWMNKSKRYGIIFKDPLVRDRFYDCIKRVQMAEKELGFGLFD